MNEKMFQATWKGVGLGQFTFQELAQAVDTKGYTGVHRAACFGHLDKIPGRVIVQQLASVRTAKGGTALHIAAGFGHLDQINGGATANELAMATNPKGDTALHRTAFYGHLKQIKGGVTADQLAADKSWVMTALQCAARAGCLDQVKGGVSVAKIMALGESQVLEEALRAGNLHQLQGGVTLVDLQAVRSWSGRTARDLLHFQTQFGKETILENNLTGCPEAVQWLDPEKPRDMKVLRGALNRNHAGIGALLSPQMVAALI